MPETSPASPLLRALLLTALAPLLWGGVLSAGSARAGGPAPPPAWVLSPGSRPTTETVRQMKAREARFPVTAPVRLRPGAIRQPAGAPLREALPGRGGVVNPPSLGATAVQGVPAGFQGTSLAQETQAFGIQESFSEASGAIGPNDFVEMVNSAVAIYERDTGGQRFFVPAANFFGLVNAGTPYPRNGIFALRVLYDPHTSRWFACALERGVPGPGGINFQSNHCLLAISRTSDPTGIWDKYLIPIGISSQGSVDSTLVEATLGLDDNGVYIGATCLKRDRAQGNAVVELIPLLACIAKPPLIAPAPSLGGSVAFLLGGLDFFSSPQVPQNFDSVGPQAPAYVIGSSYSTLGSVRYLAVNWNSSVPSLTVPSTLETGDYGLVLAAPAKGELAAEVNAGDDRLQGSMIRNGRLWTCRSVGVNASGGEAGANRTGCEWLELQTASNATLTLVQSGRVFDPAVSSPRFYFQPSVAVSGQGHMALGFHGSRAAEYLSAFTCGRLAGNPAGTTGAVALVKAGTVPSALLPIGGLIPWGFYTQTSVDPTDDQTLWTLLNVPHVLGTVGNGWGTWINRLTAPPPVLTNATSSGTQGQVGLTFTLTGTGFFDPDIGFGRPPTVSLSGTGIVNPTVSMASATSATVELELAADAPLGPRSVTFTNPDGQSSTLPNAFTVIEAPIVQLESSAFTALEADGVAEITVIRSGNLSVPVSVNLVAGAGGTASGILDFMPGGQTATFAAGVTQRTVLVTVADDFLLEGNETFSVQLSNVQGGILGSQSSATVTIADDLAKPKPGSLVGAAVTYSSIHLHWVDDCQNEAGFELELQENSGPFQPLGSAAANSTEATISPVTPGTTYRFRIRAVAGSNASDWRNSPPLLFNTLQFSAASYTGPEGFSQLSVTVTRTGNLIAGASVTLAFLDGTAVRSLDYAPLLNVGPILEFQPSEATKTFTIILSNDRLLEGDETLRLELSNAVGLNTVLGERATAVVTITDNLTFATPTNLAALPIGPTTVRLTWTDHCDNETGYQLERSSGGGEFAVIGSTGANATTAQDTTATAGTAYTYRVRAINGALQSNASNTALATIPVSVAPTITPARLSFGKVKLGKTKTLKVTIKNPSKTAGLAGLVSLSGTGYTLDSGGGPFDLAPKGKLTVSVTFRPPAAGTFSGAVTVLTTAPTRPTTSISLTGVGK